MRDPQRAKPRADGLKAVIEDAIGDTLGLDRAELEPYARLHEDLGVDSYDLCELIEVLESQLGATIPEHAFGAAQTLEELVRVAIDATASRGESARSG